VEKWWNEDEIDDSEDDELTCVKRDDNFYLK